MQTIKNQRVRVEISLILGFILLLACARKGTIAPVLAKPEETIPSQVFQAPFYKVFRAAFVTLEDAGYSIASASLKKGMITTEWKVGIEEPNDAFFLHQFGYSNIRRRVTINLIQLNENSTKVEIQGLTQFGDDFKGWRGKAEDMPAEVVIKSCQKYFKAIQQKLARR